MNFQRSRRHRGGMFGTKAAKQAYEKTGVISPWTIRQCMLPYRRDGYTFIWGVEYETCEHCGHTRSFYPKRKLPDKWKLIDVAAGELDSLRDRYLEARQALESFKEGIRNARQRNGRGNKGDGEKY